jgi:hypothetical protein
MSTHTLPVIAILVSGVGMGFAGDYLLRAPEEPGLNGAILFAGVAGSVLVISLTGGLRLGREAATWLAVGVFFGAGLLWRGSGLLRFLAFASAATAFTLPALHAGRAWVRKAGLAELEPGGLEGSTHREVGIGTFEGPDG